MYSKQCKRPQVQEKSGSFKNNEKYAIFDSFYFFVKNVEIQMKNWCHIWKALLFFLISLPNFMSRKVWFIKKWAWSDPDWRDYSDFWPDWMNQYSKSTCVTKMIFWVLKEILEDYLPWKFQPQSFSGSWNMGASVFVLVEWSKFFLEKFLDH